MPTLLILPAVREEVAYSIQALEAAGDDNTTLLAILQALHPDEWANLCERVELTEGDVSVEGRERTEVTRAQLGMGWGCRDSASSG